MNTEQMSSPETWVHGVERKKSRPLIFCGYLNRVLVLATVVLFFYGVVWNYSTRRYLKGFADAIVPLDGSPEEKSEALLGWLREGPDRRDAARAGDIQRDPVRILQDARLLKICGSASNAFVNLADATGLRTRRLLLLDASGGTTHVVVEVQWGDRWVVVDPSFRAVFRDKTGRALTKDDLRDPAIFGAATSRIPNYDPVYKFDHTAHIRLMRIPVVGTLLRRTLTFLFPQWEEIVNWGYFPENPSLWPILLSLPLFLLGIIIRLLLHRHSHDQVGVATLGFRERLIESGRVFFHRSA
jgi:hypothetical protein